MVTEESNAKSNESVTSQGDTKPGDDSNNGDNESGDVIYAHVNDEFEAETFQIDDTTKEEDAAKTEKAEDAESKTDKSQDDKEKERLAKEQEQKARAEKLAKVERERLYKLPTGPHIVVHPSKTAKAGKL